MNRTYSSFSRRGPDIVTEELVEVLSGKKSFEFKALFDEVHAGLRARNAASGGEEMLRLRAYEKLQNLVNQGQVKRIGKEYKGDTKSILALGKSLKAIRKSGTAGRAPAASRSTRSTRKTKSAEAKHARN